MAWQSPRPASGDFPLCEQAGGKLLNLYFTLGQHNFLLISEMPDARAATAISFAASGGGGIRDVVTTQAFTAAEARASSSGQERSQAPTNRWELPRDGRRRPLWPRTNFLELLGIAHPIVQAPMAGFTTPALTAAVFNAGGLGSIGCAILPAAAIREQVAAVGQATNRPFNLNFFDDAPAAAAPEATALVRAWLAPCFAEFGSPPAPCAQSLCHRDGRVQGTGASVAGEPRRPTLTSA